MTATMTAPGGTSMALKPHVPDKRQQKQGPSIKSNVADNPPMRIGALDFGVMPADEIERQAELEVSDRNLYNLDPKRNPTEHGPLDRRLGTGTKTAFCGTCGELSKDCSGHWGFVRLEAPCFHIGFLHFTIEILNQVCKTCCRILLSETSRRKYLRRCRQNLDSFQRKALIKKINAECRKVHKCPHCTASNGPVRKVSGHACKLVHLKFEAYMKSTAKSKKMAPDMVAFENAFQEYIKANQESEKHVKKAIDDLPAIRVHRIFSCIPIDDCELLGIDASRGRPESYLWTHLPVPPPNIRPSVPGDQGTTEDELTTKLSEIIDLNTQMRMAIQKDEHMSIQMDYYEKLQDHIAMYINSHAPGLNKSEYGKAIRSFCSRLKGKQGRFRGNLSGKRVNFSGRTVISPDPNLSVEEVGIPVYVAKILTYPERVTKYNIEKLREAVKNGASRWPGANSFKKPHEFAKALKGREARLREYAKDLQVGYVVNRHIADGDTVLFNRQPSLHKLSILCHQVKVYPGRTFRFNESVCTPYNADFDGDEMNIHVPQTEEAKAEARILMGVKSNLVTPKNGATIIAPIQDFITAAYLLSNKDKFFTRHQFSQIMGWMFDANVFVDPDSGEKQSYELPPPTIWKPMYLWTGKQIFNVLMRPSKACKVLVNVEAKLREYTVDEKYGPSASRNDGYLIVRNSEVMCGVMDKSAIGEGKKSSIFFAMLRDYGEDYAVQGMNRLAKLASRWLMQQGFSIGIGDVYPSQKLNTEKGKLVGDAYEKSRILINKFKSGKLTRDPGCNEEQTLENKISQILSEVRNAAGEVCFQELSNNNAAVIMAKCGSKGGMINVSQMTAGVGQQMISQKRVENGFQDRTLPHFPKGARDPASKGFVSNSFFSGLTPTEFIFHAMSGREGLVDTAVKTAETGYMSRRLIKSLEDAYVVYDRTVRNSSKNLIQFNYGDDSLDPAELEGAQRPVHLERTFSHAVETTRDENDAALRPDELRALAKEILETKYQLDMDNFDSDVVPSAQDLTDDKQAIRKFVSEILEFINTQASLLERLYKQHKIPLLPPKNDSEEKKQTRELNSFLKKARVTPDENQRLVDKILKISERTLREYLNLCFHKFEKSHVQPGHAVGAIAAQSIGEPGTQMTLKTFHFAGVAGMSITQGVPRIKEIINAAKKISTPVITCVLQSKSDLKAARYVKGLIERTYLRDIAQYIVEMWRADTAYLKIRIDMDRVEKLKLDLNARDIVQAIMKTKGIKLDPKEIEVIGRSTIRITPEEPKEHEGAKQDADTGAFLDEDDEPIGTTTTARGGTVSSRNRRKKKQQSYFQTMQDLRRQILNVTVKGHPDTNRAIIKRTEATETKSGKEELELLVEGYGLKACMTTEGVDGLRTTTNSVMETAAVLGIEAARGVIESEIQTVMSTMDIDTHHIGLLACIMTLKGEVLGITRFGMVKMGDSVLQLASFEKTPDHLFEAATRMKSDPVSGVSESIIMGQGVRLGTGLAQVVKPLELENVNGRLWGNKKEGAFEAAWKGADVAKGWDGGERWSTFASEPAMEIDP
jgi:DNA-directed RNA polymerase III subunit RPC1